MVFTQVELREIWEKKEGGGSQISRSPRDAKYTFWMRTGRFTVQNGSHRMKEGFEGQWNENVRLWYNLLIIIQYTKVPFQGPFRML